MDPNQRYSAGHFHYERILSREVNIGGVPLGGHNPIRIQSMTTTDTMDTLGTVEQTKRLVHAGCEYVRITAPSQKEAHNLAEIKKELRRQGYTVPLIADIHFTPNAAEVAARIVEKVRVNPGNYADKKRFEHIEYTDDTYQSELQRIYDRFSPLVKICKTEGTVMRIGTNHGSLSDRILSRYGDTPEGMVESALEFLRICEDHGFHDVVISMKASNPQVMVQAYRMLMMRMRESGIIYPLHLGVTEAGDGEDGRIKSALGISTLLLDGIGDTVRVSLTEEPEYESPVAQFLVDHYVKRANEARQSLRHFDAELALPFNPLSFSRRQTQEVINLGSGQPPRVIANLEGRAAAPADLAPIGYSYSEFLDKYNFSDIAADYVFLGNAIPDYELPGGLKRIVYSETWQEVADKNLYHPFFRTLADYLGSARKSPNVNFVQLTLEEVAEAIKQPQAFNFCVLVLNPGKELIPTYVWRAQLYSLIHAGISAPVVLKMDIPEDFGYFSDAHLPDYVQIPEEAKVQLALASDASTLLVDGLVDGIWLENADLVRVKAAFAMLQLARLRMTKTEYISCPSCGRTLFDLQETTARIRKRTEHLKGVKIGIMGCIVNGPGEMADADYGYVGVGPDKIALYRGQTVVEKAIKTEFAVDRLIDLIREDGKWVEQEMAVVG